MRLTLAVTEATWQRLERSAELARMKPTALAAALLTRELMGVAGVRMVPEQDSVGSSRERLTITQNEQLGEWFTYHPPQDADVARLYERIRGEARDLAEIIVALVPAGREQDLAIDAVRQASMWANAGIACHG